MPRYKATRDLCCDYPELVTAKAGTFLDDRWPQKSIDAGIVSGKIVVVEDAVEKQARRVRKTGDE